VSRWYLEESLKIFKSGISVHFLCCIFPFTFTKTFYIVVLQNEPLNLSVAFFPVMFETFLFWNSSLYSSPWRLIGAMFCLVNIYSRVYEQHMATLSGEVNYIILNFISCSGPLFPFIHSLSRGLEWLQISQNGVKVEKSHAWTQNIKQSAKVYLRLYGIWR
jgi:hypothetical protein